MIYNKLTLLLCDVLVVAFLVAVTIGMLIPIFHGYNFQGQPRAISPPDWPQLWLTQESTCKLKPRSIINFKGKHLNPKIVLGVFA